MRILFVEDDRRLARFVAGAETGVPRRVLEGPPDPAGRPEFAARGTMEASRLGQFAAVLLGRSLLRAAVRFALAAADGGFLARRVR